MKSAVRHPSEKNFLDPGACITTCGPPGVLEIWGEWLFIFRDLGSTGNYLRGAGEQAHNLGSPAKKQGK